MTIMPYSERFNELSVALPSSIQQPLLRQLAERLQTQLLDGIESFEAVDANIANNVDSNCRTDNSAQSARILQTLYDTPITDAAVLVAITNEPEPKLLLTRRAAHMTSHAGEVSCAGGRHEEGDGNNIVTALREAHEETALPPSKVQIIGQLPMQLSKSGMSVRPIVALIEPDLLLIAEIGEIARIFWADFATLVTQEIVEYEIEYTMLEQTSIIVTPSWQVADETVWGLTGKIIANLLEIGFDRKVDWYYRLQDTGRLIARE